jgi:glycine amidinotransferase
MSPASSETSRPVVHSCTEWDPLEEVIVGSVLGAMYPECGPILAANGEPEWLWHYQGTFIDDAFVQAAHAQLEEFVHILEAEGVKVRRPEAIPHNTPYSTPYWQCRGGWNTANPRDMLLVVGDEIIECATPLRHRHFESLAYHRLLTEYFRKGARWTSAPRPALRESLYDFAVPPRPHVAGSNHGRTLLPGETHRYPITEAEPVFEAADFMRCGRDLFVTRSIVTNQLGIEWVQRHLGPSFRVHLVETRCATPWHIDTTLVPLCPGKVLCNPEWMTELPAVMKGWEVLWAPPPSYASDSPMSEAYFTSQWLSMNVLSLDEKRLFVDAQQTELMGRLRDWGFQPIAVPFDCVGRFGGSFHCATVDVRRQGTLQSYF